MTPLLEAVLNQPLSAAERSGLPIVAYASNNVPIELIHAAGCFPLQLPTAPRASTSRADRYLEARFEPLTRVALELLLAGELSCARLLVLPRTNDSWQRLYYYLCELRRSFGEQLPEPFLYDLLHTPYPTSAAYNRASTQLLADRLAALSGKRYDASALATSSARYNRLRDKLQRFMARRWTQPCQLSGATALDVYTAAQRLGPAQLDTLLDGLLDAPAEPAQGVRTLLVGSPHDTPALHHIIARAGGQVVADYHARGDLSFAPPVPEHGDPLPTLSDHYHQHSLSPRTFPTPLPPLLALAARAHAEAAIFFFYEEEEALTWDQRAQEAALRACGIPTLLLDRASYPPSPALEPRLAQFFAAQRKP